MTAPTPVEIELLAYNLLAPVFVQVPGAPYSDFAHVAPEHLDEARRIPRLLDRIRRLRPDVACLQEVQFEPGDEAAGELPWVPPRALRRFAEAEGFRVVPAPLTAGQWRSQQRRNERATGRSACVGLVTLLGPRAEAPTAPIASSKALIVGFEIAGARFSVVNVHLEGHPDKRGPRCEQMQGALRKAARLGTRHLVVAGDFNADLTDEPDLVRAVADRAGGATRADTGLTWSGQPGVARRVDHVVLGPSLEVVSAMGHLDPAEVASGLPSAEQPSDHVPVVARVRIRGAPATLASAAASPPPATALRPERAQALERAWRALLAEAPPKPPGPPDPEARAALKAFKVRKQAFLEGLDSDAERRFVRKLS